MLRCKELIRTHVMAFGEFKGRTREREGWGEFVAFHLRQSQSLTSFSILELQLTPNDHPHNFLYMWLARRNEQDQVIYHVTVSYSGNHSEMLKRLQSYFYLNCFPLNLIFFQFFFSLQSSSEYLVMASLWKIFAATATYPHQVVKASFQIRIVMQWSHRLVCWTPGWCGLCLSPSQVIVSDPWEKARQPHISLHKEFRWAPTKGQGNRTIWVNIKSHGGRVAFALFHSFHPSQETQIQDGDGNARRESFDPVPIKLAKNQSNILGVASTKVSFDKLFCTYCFLLLLIVHEFYFLKNQHTIVEYKGALDASSKTFRSVET